MTDRNAITAMILAGGQSSRMGRDKALIEINQVALIRQVYEVAAQCASRVYVVTPRVEQYREVLPEQCRFVEEVLPAEATPPGPLIGFEQGLKQVQTDWVLLLACDLPNLQATTLQNWARQLQDIPEEAIAFVPHTTKGWEPLCAFYRRACLTSLEAYIKAGGRSFQGWLDQTSVTKIPLANPHMLFNCNTPADLNAVRSETKHSET